MRKLAFVPSVVVLPLVFATVLASDRDHESFDDDQRRDVSVATIHADIIASGIPGAGAIAQVGTFHSGGPFHDNATFVPFTQPGRVLDRRRLFVASTSNFGAPLARANDAAGSILSIDVGAGAAVPIVVPPDFASAGGQATAAGGAVIVYTAQSPAFLNAINNPAAATHDRPSVSLPLGISFNNGFGRPWFASATMGSDEDGVIGVTDPSGAPLAGAPSVTAGGVFAGGVTNRTPGSPGGLTSAALATALATKSPDLGIRAVFFAALADGSVAQVHVQKGVDALVPAGSFTPIAGIDTASVESSERNAITRVGMVFNWVPTRILYVSDPLSNRILVMDINDEGLQSTSLFEATNVRYLRSRFFDRPVDIAPAQPEVGARNFASNTTLGGGSDLYVLNRGNNTVVRITQDGTVLAVRRIVANERGLRVAGLAVSEDARAIWVTATAPNRQGVILEIPTFGAPPATLSAIHHAKSAGADGAAAQGADIFQTDVRPERGLGPLFNGQACNTCHNTVDGTAFAGGMGVSPDTFILRVAHIRGGQFDPLVGRGGPVARQRSIAEFGFPCDLQTGVPHRANATSNRSAMTLRGTSLLDTVRVADIDAVRQAQPPGVQGRLNVLADGRIGRFGWKAQTATLVEFMGEAFRDELGLTNPLAPRDFVRGCGASFFSPEADAAPLTSLVAFLETIDPPVPAAACIGTAAAPSAGAALFASTGCATCHKPEMPGPGNAGPTPTTIRPYTDLLLHDLGPALADGFLQGSATGSEFRTAPLWRVSDRRHFLHDGRASTIVEAIAAHGGQASAARAAFDVLSPAARQLLLDFLNCI